MKNILTVLLSIYLLSICVYGQTEIETYVSKTRELIGQGKPNEALIVINRAISFNPENPELYIGRAEVYSALNNPDAMKQDIFQAVNFNPNDERNIRSAAGVLFQAQKFGREYCGFSVSILDGFLANNPKADKIFSFRAIVKKCAGDYYGAYQDFTKASELVPDSALNKSAAVRSLMYIGDSPQALTLLTKMIADYETKLAGIEKPDEKARIKYTLVSFYRSRADVYEKQANIEAMFSDLTKAIEIMPDEFMSYALRGTRYIQYEKYNEAIEDFNQVIALDKNNSFHYLRRGDLHYRVGNYSKALEDFQKLHSTTENIRLKDMLEKRIEQTKSKLQSNN